MFQTKGHIDWLILLPVAALMFFSLAFVYSASATIAAIRFGSSGTLFWNHAQKVLLGFVLILVFSKIDYHFWKKFSKPILITAIVLLVIVLFTSPINDVRRWISLGPLTFQPSELAKFAMVLHFAVLLERKQEVIKDFKEGFAPFLLWTGVICYLIIMQPNFSTAAVIYIIALAMLFIGNTNLLHVAATTFASLGAAAIYLTATSSYRLNRILAYFGDPGTPDKAENLNYQLNQALIALGNGGMFGVGPGQSRQSHLFLPESYGDFILSIIGEEYGFIGILVIISLFILIFWRGMIIAKNAPDNFGYFLATGIIITFAFYVFVNSGVNSGLLPTTGLPMPFISYGGTAVLIYSAAIGVLLNISSQAGIYPRYADDEDEAE